MKTIKTFAFAVLALAMSFATTSCNKDDAGTASVSTTSQSASQAKAGIDLKVTLSEDMFSLYDMKLVYTDGNGVEQSETITKPSSQAETIDISNKKDTASYYVPSYTINKKVAYTKMPISTVAWRIEYTAKATPTVTKDAYDLYCRFVPKQYSSAESYSGALAFLGANSAKKQTADQAKDFVEKANFTCSKTFSLSSDGKFSMVSTRGRLFY